MRNHPRGNDRETRQALAILSKEDPSDTFSLTQWSLGLPYFQQRLATWGLAGDVCLDFGCGTGNWTLAASRVFGRVVGIDTNPKRLRAAISIRNALEIGNVTFESDMGAMNGRFEECDCILLCNVLPFMTNRSDAIRQLITLLKPGGRVVVSFNEIGVWPYYLLSGIRSRDPSYLRTATILPAYFVIQRFLKARSVFESTQGWLRTADVVAFFQTLGFVVWWKSWDTPAESSVLPLFPASKYFLPFFREIVFHPSTDSRPSGEVPRAVQQIA